MGYLTTGHREALSLVYLTGPNEVDKRVLMDVLIRNCSNCPSNIDQTICHRDTPFTAMLVN